ncbi:bacteriorhodopsin-like [Novosphingobium sp. FKTRR1]|uniref:bacteriorhodopsin-like n=1 Tax=unclassified Novosphingobium TaxID=2644732 RepID=UPI001CEFCFBB|nr:bacteriorhodopsin-like [Novosphingobium sp. FKTRR1]
MQGITLFQYSLIYNAFSFTLAAMAATTLFLWISRSDVAAPYRTAVTISGLVTAIAAYHYWRIFNSWEAAYDVRNGVVAATGYAFNDAYRYVDWLLTVPLLLVELVLVMRLDPADARSKSLTLGFAAALMIVLGYPGEVAADIPTRALWGTLSAIPFVYIVWQLFSGLGASIERQPGAVKGLVKQARLLTFASWGFYPIVYMAPYVHLSGADATTTIQLGYTIADLIAKAVVGLLVFNIAVRKSQLEAA